MKSESNRCPTCDSKRKYSRKYDSYYCSTCKTWLENRCEDEECFFCKDRPERPE